MIARFFEYDVRYDPDWPLRGGFKTFNAALAWARKRADRDGMGPLLIYGENEHGEHFVTVADD